MWKYGELKYQQLSSGTIIIDTSDVLDGISFPHDGLICQLKYKCELKLQGDHH